MREKGADVSYADPYVPSITIGEILFKAVNLDVATIASADCVLILTDHREFPYARVIEAARLIVDSRNATFGMPAPAGRIVRL